MYGGESVISLYSALTCYPDATLSAMTSGWFAAGALLAGAGVGLGAFGAHGLKSKISADMLAVFEVGVRYQVYHALALLAVSWATTRWPGNWVNASGWLFLVGILLFSGSLYVMTFTGQKWLGAVTPLGGVCFILGWVFLAVAAGRGQ